MSKTADSWLEKVRRFLESVSFYHWLLGLAISGLTLWRSKAAMPDLATYPASYFGASCFLFFGTLFVVSGGARVATLAWPKVKRWHNPHSVVPIARGGEHTATLEITHYGSPARWEVRRRISGMVNERHANPDPVLRKCYLHRDDIRDSAMTLNHGESASVVLASVQHSEWSNPWMVVNDIEDIDGTRVPDEGVIVEVEISSKPSMRGGTIVRHFEIWRECQVIYVRDLV
jgi:hypothetical protein